MYQLQPLNASAVFQHVSRLEDGSSIPFDPANTDYQAYLRWLGEGNEPLPADEPAPPAD